jgi:hypothetical protein
MSAALKSQGRHCITHSHSLNPFHTFSSVRARHSMDSPKIHQLRDCVLEVQLTTVDGKPSGPIKFICIEEFDLERGDYQYAPTLDISQHLLTLDNLGRYLERELKIKDDGGWDIVFYNQDGPNLVQMTIDSSVTFRGAIKNLRISGGYLFRLSVQRKKCFER